MTDTIAQAQMGDTQVTLTTSSAGYCTLLTSIENGEEVTLYEEYDAELPVAMRRFAQVIIDEYPES